MNELTIEVATINTANVIGPRARHAFAWFKRLGVPCQWNRTLHCWMVPRSRVADLVADAERSKRPVTVTGAWA